jgi:two-component system, LytTR family, response regulator
MINCIAVDDEKPALELLADNISKLSYLNLVAKCRNAVDAMEVIRQQQIDLVFLDIQMPGLTGLQFVQTMAVKPMVIFITAYEKYALDGFNLDVVDYLLKPVSLERFIRACNKAHDLFILQNKPSTEIPLPPGEHLFVPADYSFIKLEIGDILFIEASKDHIRIYLKAMAVPVITRMSMKAVEDKLPAGKFIRIHKSYIVAVKYITVIRKDTVALTAVELPLGINYRENIRLLTGS